MEPAWEQKSREGKMFVRLVCATCHAVFHFSDTPRVTRTPRCPACGSMSARNAA